jgi:hypothetical protein
MKKMLFAATLFLAFSTASFSGKLVTEGKSNSSLGTYKIEISDSPVTMNGEVLKTYFISYENSPLQVKVAIKKEKDCKKYIVLSDKLSVQYVCNGAYFGVQLLEKSPEFEKSGFSMSDKSLNRAEYFHQKVLTTGKPDEIESTQFIASYFPLLIKNEFVATN